MKESLIIFNTSAYEIVKIVDSIRRAFSGFSGINKKRMRKSLQKVSRLFFVCFYEMVFIWVMYAAYDV